LTTIFHEEDDHNDDTIKAQRKFETYIEYGRRFEKLLREYNWQF
jgi:hypothetical protein